MTCLTRITEERPGYFDNDNPQPEPPIIEEVELLLLWRCLPDDRKHFVVDVLERAFLGVTGGADVRAL